MRDTGLRFVNFLLHFAVVLCLALACRAQGASNIPNTISIQASGAPSGVCGNNFVYTNSATNDFYNCVAGAWNKVTSAGGGSGTVTSIATTGPIGGGTITTTGTITCTTCTTATTPTAHGVILGAGTQALGVTAAGTTGQVLTGVTGADPVWGTPSAGCGSGVNTGGLCLLEEHTASNSATLDFTTCISSTYDDYEIRLINVLPATAATDLGLRFSTNGGSSYDTGNHYGYSTWVVGGGGGTNASGSSAAGIFLLMPVSNTNTSTGGAISATYYLSGPANGTVFPSVHGTGVSYDGTNYYSILNAGKYLQTTAINAFRFLFESGNITSGTVRCYGLTK